jgi:selT/selW/selH-like putative selenoprotein
LAEELYDAFGVKAKLIPGQNGVFDVIADGELVFSKFETGRFPRPAEVITKLKQ